MGLCCVKGLLGVNSIRGEAKDKSQPRRDEGTIKIPQGENQMESAGRGAMPLFRLRVCVQLCAGRCVCIPAHI